MLLRTSVCQHFPFPQQLQGVPWWEGGACRTFDFRSTGLCLHSSNCRVSISSVKCPRVDWFRSLCTGRQRSWRTKTWSCGPRPSTSLPACSKEPRTRCALRDGGASGVPQGLCPVWFSSQESDALERVDFSWRLTGISEEKGAVFSQSAWKGGWVSSPRSPETLTKACTGSLSSWEDFWLLNSVYSMIIRPNFIFWFFLTGFCLFIFLTEFPHFCQSGGLRRN